jgi:hypothetical protein
MSFVRSSKVTTKAVVPVLLAGLLATGIVFLEASPAKAAACSTTDTGYGGGNGAESAPFQISTAAQLIRLSKTSADWSSKHFTQTANIDLGNCGWTPIGASSGGPDFTGTYDGQGFTISGLDLRPAAANGGFGLFGTVDSATIKNLVVSGIIVAQQGDHGGVVGRSKGTTSILRVRSEVNITHSGYIVAGGIVGTLSSGDLTVSESNYAGTMTLNVASGAAAGIIGVAGPTPATFTLTDSYSQVTFAGTNPTLTAARAGLIGTSTPTAVRNYSVAAGAAAGISSTGLSGTSEGSFWDSEVGPTVSRSNGTAVPGTTAKTTSQMKTRSTYTTTVPSPSKELPTAWAMVQGWEAYNYAAPSNKWGICVGINGGYPFHLWQFASNPCSLPASAPTITAITASSESLSVAFTAPSSDGGAAISNYKYSLDNGATWITRSSASTSSPLVITGLTNGTSYQVRLLAINVVDDGAFSAAVNATPISTTPSQSPSPTSSPSSSVAPATTPASLTAPAATLAVTGSDLLSNWGFVVVTFFVGLALLLISGFRSRELDAK